MFWSALALKKANIPMLNKLSDYFVLYPIKSATGGQLRFAMSAGASIGKDTQKLLSSTIKLLMQGESCIIKLNTYLNYISLKSGF
jgi:long-chain acyl-CoA synthetase